MKGCQVPDLPLGSLRTTGQIVSELRSQPRVRASVLGALGGLTVLLAAIGVGGVTGQMVEQRRRDIGIRMALGALRSHVRGLVLGHTMKLAGLGLQEDCWQLPVLRDCCADFCLEFRRLIQRCLEELWCCWQERPWWRRICRRVERASWIPW